MQAHAHSIAHAGSKAHSDADAHLLSNHVPLHLEQLRILKKHLLELQLLHPLHVLLRAITTRRHLLYTWLRCWKIVWSCPVEVLLQRNVQPICLSLVVLRLLVLSSKLLLRAATIQFVHYKIRVRLLFILRVIRMAIFHRLRAVYLFLDLFLGVAHLLMLSFKSSLERLFFKLLLGGLFADLFV